jgi:uncharacterized protein YgfB (UPF0149 family)
MDVTGQATEYGTLAELLGRSRSPLPLPELHGGLCGVICASGRDAAGSWLDSLVDDCVADADTLSELSDRLQSLGYETWRALSGFSMEFSPLLPDDDYGIDQRAEALGLWCHGFLAGLVVGGLDLSGGQSELSAELNELVRDLAEISKVGADGKETEDPELGDSSLVELVEYVRVGAQYIFEELAPEPADERRTIH